MEKKTKNKVLITTFNRVHNCGACLQAYALQRTLETKFGVDVEHLDLLDETDAEKKYVFNIQTFIKTLVNWRENTAFSLFQNQYIKYTEKKYKKADLEKLNNRYEYFVAGSDQIWNCKNGVNPVFFLEFVKDRKKISYAASMGETEVPVKYIDQFIKDIAQFECVSVRESSLAKYIGQLMEIKPVQVLDPVFLIEKEDWEKIMIFPPKKKFILFFGFSLDGTAIRKVKELKKITGLPIWSVYKIPGFKVDRVLHRSMGPREFLGYVHEAEYIVTSSFHCAAFSLLFEKKVLVFHHETTGSRTRELINLFECESMDTVEDIEQWVKSDLFGIKKQKMESMKKQSLMYLENVFSERSV